MLTVGKKLIKKINKVFFNKKDIRGVILKNFIWLFVGNAGSRFLKAVITIYAARKLGVSEYGIFSYALGLAGFFIFFKNIGVDAILTREIVKHPEKKHQYFFTAFLIEIVLLIITAFLIIFIAPFFSKMTSAVILLPFVAFMLIFDDLIGLFSAFFRGIEKMELESIINVTTNIAIVIFGFLALYFFGTPKIFAIGYMLASATGVVIAVSLVRNYTRFSFENFDKNLVFPILRSSWPFAISGLAGMFLFNTDVILMGWWRTILEIGFYAAAQKLSGILNLGITLIGISIFPMLSRFANEENKENMKLLMESVMKLVFFITIPLIAGGIILREQLMIFVFGQEYALAAGAFAILLFSIAAIYPLTILTNFVFAYNKHLRMVRYSLTSSICNLTLGFLLIPKYGMIGASLAMVLSNFVYLVLLWRFSKKINDFYVFPGIFKIFIATLSMGIITFILKNIGLHVIINILISGLFYIFILYWLKEKILKELWLFIKF